MKHSFGKPAISSISDETWEEIRIHCHDVARGSLLFGILFGLMITSVIYAVSLSIHL